MPVADDGIHSLVFSYLFRSSYLERVDALALLVERVHQVHLVEKKEEEKEEEEAEKKKGEELKRGEKKE